MYNVCPRKECFTSKTSKTDGLTCCETHSTGIGRSRSNIFWAMSPWSPDIYIYISERAIGRPRPRSPKSFPPEEMNSNERLLWTWAPRDSFATLTYTPASARRPSKQEFKYVWETMPQACQPVPQAQVHPPLYIYIYILCIHIYIYILCIYIYIIYIYIYILYIWRRLT